MAQESLPANYQMYKDYKWYNSFSIPLDVQCGLCRLEFPIDLNVSSSDVPEDIYFTAYVVCNQIPMHETPVSTQYSIKDTTKNTLVWDYVLTFPIKFRDLSLDAILVLTASTPDGVVFGGTSMRFFDDLACLKRGKQKLLFFFDTPGDSNAVPSLNRTPGELYQRFAKNDINFQLEKNIEAYNNSQAALTVGGPPVTMKRDGANSSHLEWLDRLTLNRNRQCLGAPVMDDILSDVKDDLQSFCFLIVELPTIPYPVSMIFLFFVYCISFH